MDVFTDKGKVVGYRCPDCVPVFAESVSVDAIRNIVKRWNVDEGRDYLLCPTEYIQIKIDLYTLGA